MKPALKVALVLVWANLSVWPLGLIITVFSGRFGMVHRATSLLMDRHQSFKILFYFLQHFCSLIQVSSRGPSLTGTVVLVSGGTLPWLLLMLPGGTHAKKKRSNFMEEHTPR